MTKRRKPPKPKTPNPVVEQEPYEDEDGFLVYPGETMEQIEWKKANKGRFYKGDPRCWRGGRPKSFDAFRNLAQQLSHEILLDNKGFPVTIDEHVVTVTEDILRQWMCSVDPRTQKAFLEIAYGKVPDRNEITGAEGAAIPVDYVNYRSGLKGDDDPS